MHRLGKYKATDQMSDLICDNYPILLIMSRFGMALGFGDKTVAEVCEESDVDTPTFLAVVNMLMDDDRSEIKDYSFLSVRALVDYLRKSHFYFLDFRLSAIRKKLAEAINYGHSDVSVAIMHFFDEYVAEVRKHMQYEEDNVFPYVEALISGKDTCGYNISIFRKQHDQVESKLTELKNIIIKYYPAESSNEMNSVLFDIFSCAKDLASHNDVEDNLFVPAIMQLEQEKGAEV